MKFNTNWQKLNSVKVSCFKVNIIIIIIIIIRLLLIPAHTEEMEACDWLADDHVGFSRGQTLVRQQDAASWSMTAYKNKPSQFDLLDSVLLDVVLWHSGPIRAQENKGSLVPCSIPPLCGTTSFILSQISADYNLINLIIII